MSHTTTSRLPIVNVKNFSDALRGDARKVLDNKGRVKVKQGKKYFVVLSADEWESEQETLYVLQDNDLVRQIAESSLTHARAASKRR